MYLIEDEKELEYLNHFLREYSNSVDELVIDPKELTILKKLVRRLGRLREEVPKTYFHEVMKREELEFFKGMTFLYQWIGLREFMLHKQLTPALSAVMELEWDAESLEALAYFLSQFYEIVESETTYVVEVKPFLKVFGEGDFYQLEKDLTVIWETTSPLIVH